MTETTALSKVPINIEDEMQRSYLDYAMSVIVGRALPDVRDGLKPVHRRVLFTMHELGNDYNKPYKKSARVVGDVMGKYHPHGDQAIYDTIVRMAQDFSMRYLLVDGQGNFGSVDGDNAAAMRYTEVRMTRLAHDLLADLEKDTVDFGPNYDGSMTEPKILPAKYPNLLVNGSAGIAVGMATNIPPHNLGEVIDATCALIDEPELGVEHLMQHIPGPDFPTGGTIFGRGGIHSGYLEGRGSVVVRAKTEVEELKNGREAIIVTELPYQVNKARLVERIAELVRDKKLEGIADLRDESDRRGMRVVIEIKRDAYPEVVLNHLFKQTPLQQSFGINALALVDGRPKTLTLKDFLAEFIKHRREVVTRRTLFELAKAEARAHLLEGLAVALANIDEVVALIRRSKSPAEAKAGLVSTLWKPGGVEAMLEKAGGLTSPQMVDGGYKLTETQAQAILDMRLHRLTGLEQEKIHDEFAVILEEIARLKGILASDKVLMDVIKGELLEIKERFADERRTRIIDASADLSIADLISVEDMVVTVSHAGYVKRQPVDVYRSQRRGGKGKSAAALKDADFVEQVFVASTHDTILCFTDRGRVHKLKVYELPLASRTAKGKAVINLLPLRQDENEKVRQILPVSIPEEEHNAWDLVFATALGRVKKTALSAYANIRSGGIYAVDLVEGDDLIGVALLPALPDDMAAAAFAAGDDGEEEAVEVEETEEGPTDTQIAEEPGRIMLFSRSGKVVRFHRSRVRRMGRVARGVIGMRLKGDNRVISLTILEPGCQVLTITENGFGKRTEESQFPTKNRGTQGVIGIITSERNGAVVAALAVNPEDQVMVITQQGTILRTGVESIRQTARNTQGVTILKTGKKEHVTSVAYLAEPEEGWDAEEPEEGEEGEVVEGGEAPSEGGDEAPEEGGEA